MIDTHCHLDFPDFDVDRDEVIRNAVSEGVGRMINVGTSVASSRRSVLLAGKYREIYAAVGIHPHEASKAGSGDIAEIERFAAGEKVVAIGETGLDYHYSADSRNAQMESLALHIRMAKSANLPLIVHQRDAVEDTIRIFDENGIPEKVVFHCFGGDTVLLEWCIKRGFYMSFTGILTFSNAKNVRETFLTAPFDKVLVETDSPYLAPVPSRGKRNEPRFLRFVLEKLALIKGVSLKEAEETIARNSLSFFSMPG